ncbi:MAG: GNAT family N-acetyltransferase [Chloroflexales bacterium]|nr:GNAT family N-acetyltransferase [Chloroflexales bacterium]
MDVIVEPVKAISLDALTPLIIESEREGWVFLNRLADEWSSGANRFQKPGECLFLACSGNVIAGVCGLNIDPYAADPTVGRVRRLFVSPTFRGRQIGTRLVHSVIAAAHGTFRLLRVRTENPQAGRLYERLGFRRIHGEANCTQALTLLI